MKVLYNRLMEKIFYYESPIGLLEIKTCNGSITSLKVAEKTSSAEEKDNSFLKIKKQLEEYFSGNRTKFDLEVSPYGTEFQKRVWKELCKIPYGKVKSYQEIAKLVGSPKAQRAVGMACNKNPILLLIPCHRVISKSGDLTGFACGLNKKAFLLKLEKSL